jgi:hypothetical protein
MQFMAAACRETSMRRPLALLATAVVTALVLGGLSAGSAVAAPGTWLSRINAFRTANGQIRLAEDYQASQVAQQWTQHMAATNTLSHNPSYSTQVTTSWYRIGENVGYGSSEATLFQAFVNSPGHRANLLRPEYNRVGIGQVIANGRLWTTHVFIATHTATVAPAA